jgi:hypothetical protein
MADPADKSKIVPVLPNSWPILTTPLQPTPNPDLDILLPKDFRKLESESEGRRILSSMRQDPFSEPEKFLSTTGAFSEISGKRKVFVNNSGEYRDKITARLRAYGGLEIVKTAREAEFAVWYDDWAREERFKNMSGPLGIWEPETVKDVTGGTLIITIRDPSQHIPRIIWRKDDTDGGWVRRGDAHDKLVKRFISELKKLRAEK